MNGAGYIVVAWVLVLGTSAIYAVLLMRRGRALSRLVAPERRRWLSTSTDGVQDSSATDQGAL